MVLDNKIQVAPKTSKPKEPRLDGLPEGMIGKSYFLNNGCSLAPSCFDCPFEICRYDAGGRTVVKMKRDSEVTEMKVAGFNVQYIASHFELAEKTVYRILQGRKSMTMTIGSVIRTEKRRKTNVVRFWHKLYADACTRCGGAVELDYDIYSKANVLTCVMCGWVLIGKTLER